MAEITTEKTTARGSDKLFAFGKADVSELAKALGGARGDYTVKWWWKYGQPKIDHIRADLEIARDKLGPAISRIMEANGEKLQVTAEIFPNGMPRIDGYRVKLDVRQQPGG
jgi:hypothetical protein